MRFGIDIGGTKAVIARVSEEGRILEKRKLTTGEKTLCREFVTRVAEQTVEMAGGKENITTVGMGVPGTVSEREVLCAPNIGWYNEPVADYFEAVTGVTPYLAQDTRAAVWGEAQTEAMRGKKCIACVTLGTGIGCGIVLNGQIWHGALGTAGEIGHIPVVPDGRKCNCGRRGCMEAYASGLGMARSAREAGLCESTEELFELAGKGSAKAQAIIEDAVDYAAAALSALINLYSPDALLFSGGLSEQKELYVRPLIERIRSWAYAGAVDDRLYIGMASLGSDAPAIGAAFLDKA